MAGRATIRRPVEWRGIGLHTGVPVAMAARPAAPESGIVFRRVDQPGSPTIPVSLDTVVGSDRATTLRGGSVTVGTVEHFLAAVSVLQLDDLAVDVDGPELPIGDGSARGFFVGLHGAGRREHAGSARAIRVPRTLTVGEGEANYVVVPADGLTLEVTIDWAHPLIGRQMGRYVVSGETFGQELADARTFGFVHDVDALRARGLAQGASVENVVALTADGVMTGTVLRWPDEFVRHKAVDVLGDLALLGARLCATVVAVRPSHAGNVAMARVIQQAAEETVSR